MKNMLRMPLAVLLCASLWALPAWADDCKPGPSYNDCVRQHQEQERQHQERQRQEQQRQQQEHQRQEQQRQQQEHQRQEQMRQQQEHQRQEQLRQQQLQQEQQRQKQLQEQQHQQQFQQEQQRQKQLQEQQHQKQLQDQQHQQQIQQDQQRQKQLQEQQHQKQLQEQQHQQQFQQEQLRQKQLQEQQHQKQLQEQQHQQQFQQDQQRQKQLQEQQHQKQLQGQQQQQQTQQEQLRQKQLQEQQHQKQLQGQQQQQQTQQEQLRQKQLQEQQHQKQLQGQQQQQFQQQNVRRPNLPPPPPPKPPVQISPTTKVVATPANRGYIANRRNKDGSQTVVSTTTLANGQRHVTAYKSFSDPASGKRTRVYSDGRKVEITKTYVSNTTRDNRRLTVFNDGRRQERWRDGREVFHEDFRERRRPGGRMERILRRTVIAAVVGGALVALASPLVQDYAVDPVNGVDTYTYIPPTYDQPVYDAVTEPLPAPVMVSPDCQVCPPPVVYYQQPTEYYTDPTALLGDMQIADAMNDGMVASEAPPEGGQPSDPQVQALQAEVSSLQQEVAAATASNQDLQAQLADQQAQPTMAQAQVGAQPLRQVAVPEEARQQVRQQVREDVDLHRQNKPLGLRDVMASAQSQNYIFQVSNLIEATDIASNEPMVLTTGDLIKFYQVPGEGEMAAQMLVVTSKSPTVRPGAVVMVGLTDLQEMLNAFSIRLEKNMKKVVDLAAVPPR